MGDSVIPPSGAPETRERDGGTRHDGARGESGGGAAGELRITQGEVGEDPTGPHL